MLFQRMLQSGVLYNHGKSAQIQTGFGANPRCVLKRAYFVRLNTVQ
ncbi:hypothetical protein [Azospirillum largimobile]